MDRELSNHDLLIKFLSGETTADESGQVENWLKESADHQREFNDLKQLHEASDFKSEPVNVDSDRAWNKLKAKMDGTGKGAKVIRMEQRSWEIESRNFRRYFGTAAAMAGVLVAAVILFRLYQTPEVRIAGLVTKSTTLIDTLPDGSRITLNENSSLSYSTAFNNDERRVYLRGEVFFDIAKDANRPFIIEADDVEVKVLGTSFNVKAYKDLEIVEVIVETGIVQVKSIAGKEIIKLEAGDKAVYNKATGVLSKTVNEDAGYSFWRTHKLTFRNTPLKEVVDALNNYYAAEISYENENIGRCRFTATFEDDSLSTILEILSMTFQLDIKEGASGKVLSGTGCEDAQL